MQSSITRHPRTTRRREPVVYISSVIGGGSSDKWRCRSILRMRYCVDFHFSPWTVAICGEIFERARRNDVRCISMKDAVWETRFVPRPVAIVRPETHRIFQNIHQVEILLSSRWFFDTFGQIRAIPTFTNLRKIIARLGNFFIVLLIIILPY